MAERRVPPTSIDGRMNDSPKATGKATGQPPVAVEGDDGASPPADAAAVDGALLTVVGDFLRDLRPRDGAPADIAPASRLERDLGIDSLSRTELGMRIERGSEDVLQIEHGSLYPALHRLENRGWIASFWGTSDNNRKAKYYRLTPTGRRQLAAQTTRWEEIVRAIGRILKPSTEEP
jgi:transcriptional regulator